jgi:hypothetical protein
VTEEVLADSLSAASLSVQADSDVLAQIPEKSSVQAEIPAKSDA